MKDQHERIRDLLGDRRVDTLSSYRIKGKEFIEQHFSHTFKREVKELFDGYLSRPYWKAVETAAKARVKEKDIYDELKRRLGVHQTTIDRWVGNDVTISFKVFIAILNVFEIEAKDLAFPASRDVVVSGMRAAVAAIREAIASGKQVREVAKTVQELDWETWECLRLMFLSEKWFKAATTKDATLRERLFEEEGDCILKALAGKLKEPQICDVPTLRTLTKTWFKSWVIFFAVVPYRWEF